jgi:AP-3 complex subunit delta-1
VALLAFNKIVLTHPYLVAQQEDVIMDCLDNADISIRLRALDLVVGMVSSDNLVSIVGRLMRQLRSSSTDAAPLDHDRGHTSTVGVDPVAESDDESPEINIKTGRKGTNPSPLLPDEYKIDVITRILEMCSANNYGNLVDFDWYIDILLQLVRSAPLLNREVGTLDVAERVGNELRNIAVKVEAVRAMASRAAESVILASCSGNSSTSHSGKGALRPVAWIVGEYASYLASPQEVLTALLQITKISLSPECLAVYLQAVPKIFSLLAGDQYASWTPERKTMISLLMARIIHTLEPLAIHPDLEVQERAVEFSELLRLAAEASAGQEASSDTEQQDTPLLLTQAIPSLFSGQELRSVALGAQHNVPRAPELDLDQPINSRLSELLRIADVDALVETDHDEYEAYYHQRAVITAAEPAVNRLAAMDEDTAPSYQDGSSDNYLDEDIIARRRAERRERNKDDPFYIAGNDLTSGISTPLDNIIRNANENDLDIDSIPIMQLDLGPRKSAAPEKSRTKKTIPSKGRQVIQVAADETLSTSGTSTPGVDDSEAGLEGQARPRPGKSRNPLLFVDSSSIGAFSLEGGGNNEGGLDHERQQREDAEMAKAMQEVERLRLEMQRANERIEAAQGVPPEGTLVKKKVKKKAKAVSDGDEVTKPTKKKKKAKKNEETDGIGQVTSTVKKKKASRKVTVEEGGEGDTSGVVMES